MKKKLSLFRKQFIHQFIAVRCILCNSLQIIHAAAEFANYLTDNAEGYRASADDEKQALQEQYQTALYYYWYADYCPILSDAYKQTIVETGEPIDMSQYFYTYYKSGKIDPDKITKGELRYDLTYYTNENGEPGEKLTEAPSKPGDYFVKAELICDDSWSLSLTYEDPIYGTSDLKLVKARAISSYTIQAKTDDGKKDDSKKGDTKPGETKTDDTKKSGVNTNTKTGNITKTSTGSAGTGKEVKTGDENQTFLWIILAAAAFSTAGIVVKKKKI